MVRRLIGENLALLEQGAKLVEDLSDEHFRGSGSKGPGGGVGSQLRHVLDYYGCFLRDIDTKRIDYDRRSREPDVEQSRERALERAHDVARRLVALAPRLSDEEIEAKMEAPPSAPESAWSRSSVARELAFLSSHTVHHYALISHMLRVRGVDVPAEMGVAPSTLDYWNASE